MKNFDLTIFAIKTYDAIKWDIDIISQENSKPTCLWNIEIIILNKKIKWETENKSRVATISQGFGNRRIIIK